MHGQQIFSTPARWVDPELIFRGLAAEGRDAFWLDSGIAAESGRSYLGHGKAVAFAPNASADDVLAHLAERVGSRRAAVVAPATTDATDPVAGESDSAPQFAGGLIGWLSYQLGAELMHTSTAGCERAPLAQFLEVDQYLELNHSSAKLVIQTRASATADPESINRDALRWLDTIVQQGADQRAAAASVVHDSVPVVSSSGAWRHSDDHYRALIAHCLNSIYQGDAYQLCLTNEYVHQGSFDPVESYLLLRHTNPSHHGGYLSIGGVRLLSSSPEQFLSISSRGTIRTKPIKGTRPRSDDPARDAALKHELELNEKERAENLMIVDLMRNDLSRISQLGTVSVTSLNAVESYRTVHQLVSTIEAQRHPDATLPEIIRATFPAGSMTGAPKQRAMEILTELEAGQRGIYAGAFGYFSDDLTVDLAMVIRSIVLDDAGARIGAGGGITAQSDPDAEVDEMHLKAVPLIAVLDAVGRAVRPERHPASD